MTHSRTVTVAVSGGFDPIHVGHIRHIRSAKSKGDFLIVFLQPDSWLMRKKGYVFMPYEERKEILESLRWVDMVVQVEDKGDTVVETLKKYKPDIFAKGGDRTPDNMPKEEIDVCAQEGIEIVYGAGGDKVQSSSWLVNKVKKDGK